MTSTTALSFYHEALPSALKSGTEDLNNWIEYENTFLHELELMRIETQLALGPSGGGYKPRVLRVVLISIPATHH